MHTQINILKQTILDLCQGAALDNSNRADEVRILRSKIDALEKVPPSLPATSESLDEQNRQRFSNVEGRIGALEQAALVRNSSPSFFVLDLVKIGQTS